MLHIADVQIMRLLSSAFTNFQTIPNTYTCKGTGRNPPLEIKDIPANTKSLAIIMIDPDAPGGTFTHWVIWNIKSHINTIQPGEIPRGSKEGFNTKRKVGYYAPCPPDKSMHQYQFLLYALDSMLELDSTSNQEILEKAFKGHILAQAELVGQYGRE